MRCEEARPLISAGLDGELDAKRATELQGHLGECARCAAERESLSATVRLLRALPEAEPPAGLRRQIDAALLEIERRRSRHPLGLGWLHRTRGGGWAWGAAAGAAAAALVLVATRGHTPGRRIAALPPSAPVVAPLSTAPPARVVDHERQSTVSPRTKPHAAPAHPEPLRTIARALPRSSGVASGVHARLAAPARALRPHSAARLIARRLKSPLRHVRPRPAALRMASRPATPPRRVIPGTSRQSMDGNTDLASTGQNPPAPSMAAAPDAESRPDTTGMTQMAQSQMPPSPAPEDDLSELRQRLMDRPFPMPELGELKPSRASQAARDGWIRF